MTRYEEKEEIDLSLDRTRNLLEKLNELTKEKSDEIIADIQYALDNEAKNERK